MLKWQVAELAKYKSEAMPFTEIINVTAELTTTFGDMVLDASDLQVTGFAQADQEDIIVHAHVTGELIVPSSRSLKPVTLPVDYDIDEIYLQKADHAERYDLEDSVILLEGDVIDFKQAVIEFTVLQVPLQILTPEEENEPLPSGTGWTVMAEEEYEQQADDVAVEANTPLAGLKDLFKD